METGLLSVEEGEEEDVSVGREKKQETRDESRDFECWDYDRKNRMG